MIHIQHSMHRFNDRLETGIVRKYPELQEDSTTTEAKRHKKNTETFREPESRGQETVSREQERESPQFLGLARVMTRPEGEAQPLDSSQTGADGSPPTGSGAEGRRAGGGGSKGWEGCPASEMPVSEDSALPGERTCSIFKQMRTR